jgi:hypothetical protein
MDAFYENVVQPLRIWSPSAPKPKAASSNELSPDLGARVEDAGVRPSMSLMPISVTRPFDGGDEPVEVEGLPAPGA